MSTDERWSVYEVDITDAGLFLNRTTGEGGASATVIGHRVLAEASLGRALLIVPRMPGEEDSGEPSPGYVAMLKRLQEGSADPVAEVERDFLKLLRSRAKAIEAEAEAIATETPRGWRRELLDRAAELHKVAAIIERGDWRKEGA